MQQVTGRLTADATVIKLGSGKKIVRFNIAENQDYKPKGSDEWVKVPTFFSCSYWQSTGIANVLRKGAMVLLTGRVEASAYKTKTDEWAASLNFRANEISFISYAPKAEPASQEPSPAQDQEKPNRRTGNSRRQTTQGKQETQQQTDDLPF